MTYTPSQDQEQPVREKRRQDVLLVDVSLFMAATIGAHPNTCFDNVLDLFLHYFPQEFSAHGKLVEGWYVVELEDEVVLNEHGWIELASGKIIDPTVVRLLAPSCPVYYFTGVKRTWQEVQAITRRKEVWFPYVRCCEVYGQDGMEHPVYKAAHDAAVQKVMDLAHRTQPPKKMTFLTSQDVLSDQHESGMQVQVIFISACPDEEEETER